MGLPNTTEELRALVTELEKEQAQAIETYGEGSREHGEARSNLGIAQRRLDAAVYEAERRKELDSLSAREVVDRIYGR